MSTVWQKIKSELSGISIEPSGTLKVTEIQDADTYLMNKIHSMFTSYQSKVVCVHVGKPYAYTVRTFYSRDGVPLVEMVKDSKATTFDWKIYVQEISKLEEFSNFKQDKETRFREMF